MAALRAFRVLRLLKMFRYLGPLRKIAAMLLTAFASFAAIAVLIGLFWVVFAIVGMHVFGGIPLDRDGYPNFDTFLNSLVTTFNVRGTSAQPIACGRSCLRDEGQAGQCCAHA